MPIIPTVNPNSVTPISPVMGVRNDARVQPVQGGADALIGIAHEAQAIHQQATDRNDTSAVLAARRQLSDWEANTFDPANPDGIQKFQGKDALGANEALLPDLDKQVSSISATLNPRQRQAFAQVSTQFRDSIQGRLTAHMTQQHEVFLQAQDKATQDGLLNDAVSAATQGDYGTGQQRLDEGVGAIRLSLGHRGMSDSVIDAATHAYVSNYHAAIIESKLDSNPDEAQAYYGDHHDLLTADDQLKIERVLRPVATQANARALVDSWTGGTATPLAGSPVEGAAKTPAEVEAVARQSVARTVGLESGGAANAKNPGSSATGAAQFVDATWLNVMTRYRPDLTAGKSRAEVLALRNDPALSKEMATNYAIENCKGLFESGLPVTEETAYLCHHFGLVGARNILRANPNAPIASVIDPQSYAANPYLKGKTVAEVIGNHDARSHTVAPSSAAVAADGKPDFGALEARAEAIPNPLLRTAALTEIDHRRTLQDRAQRDHDESMVTTINQAVETAPLGQPYDKVLTPDQQAYARDHGIVDNVQARLQQRVSGALVQSDPVLLDAYLRESATDPATFATRKAEVLANAHKLATGDLTTLLARIDALNDPKKQGQQADWATEQQRMGVGTRMLGFDKLKPDEAKKQGALFGAAYRQAKEAYIQSYKEEPKGEKADALLRNVVRNFAENQGRGVRAYENLAAGNPMKDNAGKPVQLSERDRQQVAGLLRQRLGREPSEAEILAKVGSYYAGGGR